MPGTINSLGIGSGILTSDVIDQLRTADESRIINPLDRRIELQTQKEEALTLIDSLLTSFKSSVSQLGNDTLYQRRLTEVTNGNLEVTAETGSDVQSFSLETNILAKQNIQQSGSFSTRTDTIATAAGSLDVFIDGATYNIPYTATTTLEEFTQSINDAAGAKITASILKTGEDAFSLILTSNETGADQAITFSDAAGMGSGLKSGIFNGGANTSGFTSVQDAVDSEFVYNGITITRDSNEITDIINGVTLKLKTEGETATVDIKQDTFAISTEIQLLVDSYNALQTNLHDSTIADTEAGTMGIFNGDAFVNGIMREINSIILSTDGDNNSFVNYGIDLSRDGEMSFNQTTFEEKFAKDPAATELFFTGGTNIDTGKTVTGLFESLNDKLNAYTKFNGLFDNFEEGVKASSESLTEERATAVSRLDSRYQILTQQFIAYDAMISKLNSQFSSLQLQIEAQANGNN